MCSLIYIFQIRLSLATTHVAYRLVGWSLEYPYFHFFGPICENPEGPLFLPEFVCLSVCL